MTAPHGVSSQAIDGLVELLDARFSCRGFRPEPIARETIERIVKIAQRTASWCNSQPWQAHVAEAAATDRLRAALLAHVATHEPKPDFAWPAEYRGVYQQRRRECGLQLYEAVGVTRGDRAGAQAQRLENFRFFGAPHVAIVTTDAPLGIYGAIDCGAWVSAFMLAARGLGVAAIAQAAVAAYPDFWREQLGLGTDRLVICGIAFGREDPDHPANRFRTSRASVEEVMRWVE